MNSIALPSTVAARPIQGNNPPASHFQFRKYHFLIRRGAHLHQHAVAPNSQSQGNPSEWTTIDYCPFQEAEFADAFPVHA